MTTLPELARLHGSDKLAHGFAAFYEQHLRDRRRAVRRVLEIGGLDGASLLMWRDYFPRAEIHGVDVKLPEDEVTEYTPEAITVIGQLEVGEEREDGFVLSIYRLQAETIE